MLSASLQAETEQKKQLEDDLQHSRDLVRTSIIIHGPAWLCKVFRFCILMGLLFIQLKASKTQETLDLVQEELSEQKQMSSDLETQSKEKQSSLDQQVGISLDHIPEKETSDSQSQTNGTTASSLSGHGSDREAADHPGREREAAPGDGGAAQQSVICQPAE